MSFTRTYYLVILGLLITNTCALGAHNEITCFETPQSFARPEPAHCQSAIDMIPDGIYNFDGKVSKPLNFRLPQSVRDRKFLLPAAFLSGTCLILVESTVARHVWANPGEHPPVKAASALFTIVWPKVRQYATKITQKCLVSKEKPVEGDINLTSMLGTFQLEYKVTVTGVPPGMKGDGWKMQDWGNVYNVYESNGSSRGRGTKGLFHSGRFLVYGQKVEEYKR